MTLSEEIKCNGIDFDIMGTVSHCLRDTIACAI